MLHLRNYSSQFSYLFITIFYPLVFCSTFQKSFFLIYLCFYWVFNFCHHGFFFFFFLIFMISFSFYMFFKNNPVCIVVYSFISLKMMMKMIIEDFLQLYCLFPQSHSLCKFVWILPSRLELFLRCLGILGYLLMIKISCPSCVGFVDIMLLSQGDLGGLFTGKFLMTIFLGVSPWVGQMLQSRAFQKLKISLLEFQK